MKVVVYRSYVVSEEMFYNYGDDSETVWHKFNGFEKCYEMDDNELSKLRKAIYLYNSKHSKADHKLGVFVVCDDDEVNSLLSDYDSYLAKEDARRKREADAYEAKKAESKAKRDAKKAERELAKIAEKLNIPLEEFKAKIAAS